MDSKKAKPLQDFRMSLHGLPYDKTVAAEPPITITTAKQSQTQASLAKPGSSHGDRTVTKRESGSTTGTRSRKQSVHNDSRIPSGTTTTSSTFYNPADANSFRNSETSFATDSRAPSSSTTPPIVPQIRIDDDDSLAQDPGVGGMRADWPLPNESSTAEKAALGSGVILSSSAPSFQGLTLDLPGGGLSDELKVKDMKFSQRGSMFIDGRKVNQTMGRSTGSARLRPLPQRIVTSSSVPEKPSTRLMSTDEENLSEKVRSYYAAGADLDEVAMANRMGARWQDTVNGQGESVHTVSRRGSESETQAPKSPAGQSTLDSPFLREEHELAGGLEDWQDVDNADVDRYGFIVPHNALPPSESAAGVSRSGTVNRPGIQRVSTSLQMASESPRRKHTIRRAPSSAHGEKDRHVKRRDSDPSIKSNATRPGTSRSTGANSRSSGLRGKDRRLLDDAADMFTLPRSLSASSNNLSRTKTNGSSHSAATQPATSKMSSAAARKKEVEREGKWRKMAKPIPTPNSATARSRDYRSIGTTLLFSFPSVSDPKLISRTWKGIPDSWRAQAWHYFLSVSAAKYPASLSDDKLINLFHDYQTINSPDDVQIDIDVPRTINSHIMFRRRYRGGQRLLFRVLHAMSLHWPETGYVQGMAALAATLLAYYEEEKAFVMLVRLWDVRGLGRLYESGFGGLMEALDVFEKEWLGEGEVAKKLTEVNIFPTAYGTKWYLTLFNYSIPFPAQLRVWDVFMLLGDDDTIITQPQAATQIPAQSNGLRTGSDGVAAQNTVPQQSSQQQPLGTTLDILHATSAALIDGMRDILLESDFENAMKVLTSWIPIRDEDLFIRVAKAEWKMHRKRAIH